eukprot:6874266-Alexandrium_andersonii.AAC.1
MCIRDRALSKAATGGASHDAPPMRVEAGQAPTCADGLPCRHLLRRLPGRRRACPFQPVRRG